MENLTSVELPHAYHLNLLASHLGSSNMRMMEDQMLIEPMHAYHLNLLASHLDSTNVRMSPLWTDPFPLHLMEQLLSSKNSIQACVPPSRYQVHLSLGASTQVT